MELDGRPCVFAARSLLKSVVARYAAQGLQPVVVTVDSDVAYIYYSVTWTPQPLTGPAVPRTSRRLTVFQRQNGKWIMSGGTIATVQD